MNKYIGALNSISIVISQYVLGIILLMEAAVGNNSRGPTGLCQWYFPLVEDK